MTLKKPQDFEFDKAIFKYDPKTKWLHLKLGTEKAKIKYTDLWMMTFVLGNHKQQDDLIPVEDKEMMVFVRQHQVKATKDIKEGEMITVNCNVNVPVVVVESLLKKEGIEDIKSVLTKTKPNGN